MLNNHANTQAPLFYTPRPTNDKPSVARKLHTKFIAWRIDQLQGRIEDIQDALAYEMRQNHSSRRQQQLMQTAHEMCITLANKQQRLMQRN